MSLTFKGSIKDFTRYMETLLLIYGENAKIADIQKSIAAIREY